MKTLELRKKWIQSISKVDDRFLRMIDVLYKNYINDKTDFFDELPREIQDLLLESLKQDKSYSHKDIMVEFKKKYNIAG